MPNQTSTPTKSVAKRNAPSPWSMVIFRHSVIKLAKLWSTWIVSGIFTLVFLITFIIMIKTSSETINTVHNLNQASGFWSMIGGNYKFSHIYVIFMFAFIPAFTLTKITNLFSDEMEDGTLLLILSKPINRIQMFFEKLLALFVFILIGTLMLTIITTIVLAAACPQPIAQYYIVAQLKTYVISLLPQLIFTGIITTLAMFMRGKVLSWVGSLFITIGVVFALLIPLTGVFGQVYKYHVQIDYQTRDSEQIKTDHMNLNDFLISLSQFHQLELSLKQNSLWTDFQTWVKNSEENPPTNLIHFFSFYDQNDALDKLKWAKQGRKPELENWGQAQTTAFQPPFSFMTRSYWYYEFSNFSIKAVDSNDSIEKIIANYQLDVQLLKIFDPFEHISTMWSFLNSSNKEFAFSSNSDVVSFERYYKISNFNYDGQFKSADQLKYNRYINLPGVIVGYIVMGALSILMAFWIFKKKDFN